jgi:hypothetical protein
MKKLFYLLCLLLLGVIAGCSNNPTQADEANGHTPTEIVVRYLTADHQWNMRRQTALATSDQKENIKKSAEIFYDRMSPFVLEIGPKDNEQLDKSYQLEEFKLNDTTYFYRFTGAYKIGDRQKDRTLKVILYKGEWKVDDDRAENELEGNEANMQHVMIKESKDDPMFQEQIAADYKEDKPKGDIAKAQHEKYFKSAGEELNGYTPADIAILFEVLERNHDYLRLSKIITEEEKSKIEKEATYFTPVNWSVTVDKSKHDTTFEMYRSIDDTITEMKKDNNTYFYKVSTNFNYYYKVTRIGDEWRLQRVQENVSWGTPAPNEWDNLEKREVIPMFFVP